MSLKKTIESMAEAFADGLLRAIRDASLEDLLVASEVRPAGTPRVKEGGAPKARRPRAGRRVRRSPNQIAAVTASLVAALKGAKDGMRSEELQKALSVDKKTIVRPIADALEAKVIRKTGQKRATRYFVR
jgi:hypothetical protein